MSNGHHAPPSAEIDSTITVPSAFAWANVLVSAAIIMLRLVMARANANTTTTSAAGLLPQGTSKKRAETTMSKLICSTPESKMPNILPTKMLPLWMGITSKRRSVPLCRS